MSAIATNMTSESFEQRICELTQAVNRQYPRPWMTSLKDPLQAQVFIVGMNQRNGYDVERVGSHAHHLDALFNRNGRTCRGVYDEMTGGRPSPTRVNVDRLTSLLKDAGVTGVLETNVVCYSTPMSHVLARGEHRLGAAQGTEIFRFLLEAIRPRVLIAHGSGTCRRLERILAVKLPQAPKVSDSLVIADRRESCPTVLVIPSLAPPAFNAWARWAPAHLERVAHHVRHLVA